MPMLHSSKIFALPNTIKISILSSLGLSLFFAVCSASIFPSYRVGALHQRLAHLKYLDSYSFYRISITDRSAETI